MGEKVNDILVDLYRGATTLEQAQQKVLFDVVERKELLKAFVNYLRKENAVDSSIEYYIDEFIKINQ